MAGLDRILADALELSADEWLAAWHPELERRVSEVERGHTAAVPMDEAMRQVRQRLKSA